jgi:hypothetical protein
MALSTSAFTSISSAAWTAPVPNKMNKATPNSVKAANFTVPRLTQITATKAFEYV